MSLDITPEVAPGRSLINAYGDGGFRIAGARRQGSLIVFPERVVAWPVTEVAGISLDSLGAVIEAASGIQILVLGCGPNFTDEPDGLRQGLRGHGIVLEWMDTGAACRTFNVLLSEDRDIAAALIVVE
ncbi:MAG: Mth938-like domain-containing protein [Alphaproteobacteria bacterium]